MLSSYHKGGVNRPTFGGDAKASRPIPPTSPTPATQTLTPSHPAHHMDVVVISLRVKQPTPLAGYTSNGLVMFDEAAMQQAVAQGPALLPVLDQALRQHAATLSNPNSTQEALLRTLHTLRTAELLADSGVSINSLYPALSTLDSIPNPLLTIYLAGAYSKLTRPEPLGWALKTLAWLGTLQAINGVSTPHMEKAHEEVGKVLSFQLQQFPAMAGQLVDWYKTFG